MKIKDDEPKKEASKDERSFEKRKTKRNYS
jgi:hypothetical protein